jgi:hypothetical protein
MLGLLSKLLLTSTAWEYASWPCKATPSARRTLALAFSEYLASWTQSPALRSASTSSWDTRATSSIARGPGRLGEKKDELQLVIDNIKHGQLKLADYLLEMFERASLYFQQIGARQLPEYKVRQIMELHEMALQASFPLYACAGIKCVLSPCCEYVHLFVVRALTCMVSELEMCLLFF